AEIQLNDSLKGLFPTASSFEPAEIASPDPAVKFEASYVATDATGSLGLATKASGNSYGGMAIVLVGVGHDNKLIGVRVLENKDTPGLGANASVPSYFVDKSSKTTFPGQFAGKSLGDAFEVKKDVQAITASTITSKALTKIVKTVGDAGAAWLAAQAASGGK
ncbi:MAG: FMN-binding protein, partial [Bacillota bacterium]|nr:FMN-binding protein [Bacillota bacterium]